MRLRQVLIPFCHRSRPLSTEADPLLPLIENNSFYAAGTLSLPRLTNHNLLEAESGDPLKRSAMEHTSLRKSAYTTRHRVEIGLTAAQKDLLVNAARITGQRVSDFVRLAAEESALAVLAKKQQ